MYLDGTFEIPAVKPPPKQVAPKIQSQKSAARIDLDANAFKIIKNIDNGSFSVLVRLTEGEKSESIEAFRDHVEIHTSNRIFRVNTDTIGRPIQALGACTSFESYLNIPLIV